MEKKFAPLLKEPGTGLKLELFEFDSKDDNIIDGAFINSSGATLYPVIAGVPVVLKQGLPGFFLTKYKSRLDELKKRFPSLHIYEEKTGESWSFSLEWEFFTESKMERTWRMTPDGRFRDFLHENQVKEEKLSSLLLLDAGCGNGTLTENIANHGATIVGIDFSDSVFAAEVRRKSKNVFFVRGDLQNPPFESGAFDLIFSNGVIHHTPSTLATFKSVIKIVKPGGTLYLWLYNRQGGIKWRFKRRLFDFLRVIVCRLPNNLQKASVNIVSFFLYFFLKLTGTNADKKDLKLDIYDSITPRWRHYHEPLQVWNWYKELGFSNILISNWSSLYGYGIIGTKNAS